jgi:hypothetical protein
MKGRAPWYRVGVAVAVFIGLAIAGILGVAIGRSIHFMGSIPNIAGMFGLVIGMAFAGVIVVLLVAGAATAFRNLRLGLMMIGLAAVLGFGGYVGELVGEDYRNGIETDARVEVTFDAPISATFTGSGKCHAIDNGGLVYYVVGDAIVEVGRDRMSIAISIPQGEAGLNSIRLSGVATYGRLASYSTPMDAQVQVVSDGLRMTGSGTFEDLRTDDPGERIGGSDGPMSLSGSFSWTCLDPDGA